MKKKIYISGPLSIGDVKDNIHNAECAYVDLVDLGFAPMCPHWNNSVEDCEIFTEFEIDDWMSLDLPWVEVCDAVLRLHGESCGADIEVGFAKAKNIKVFYSIGELAAYFKYKKDYGVRNGVISSMDSNEVCVNVN